eukprot:6699-Eustigmatos_ZCMA.PRE.1
MAEENKVTMARGGVTPVLLGLIESKDQERELHAICGLANMAEMLEGRTQKRMIEDGCLGKIVRLCESDNCEVKREVARTLALFAAKRESQ